MASFRGSKEPLFHQKPFCKIWSKYLIKLFRSQAGRPSTCSGQALRSTVVLEKRVFSVPPRLRGEDFLFNPSLVLESVPDR
jgi:hypothetical protein